MRLAALAAVVALVAAPWRAPSAGAADETPSPSPSATPTGTVQAVLAPVDSGVVRDGEPLNVWVTLRNGTAYSVGSTAVTVSLGSTALGDREDLTEWLAGSSGAPGLTQVGSATIPAIGPETDGQRLILISAQDPALQNRAPGVYPLKATFRSPSATWTATSTMVIPRTDAPTTPVGLVVPITAGPLTTGLLTADQLTALTAPNGELTSELDAVDGTDAILAVDPAIPASIRVLGTSAPDSATAWLAQLMGLSNERFALQFGDADTALQTQTGHTALLQPTSLQAYMTADDFLPVRGQANPTPTPGATPQPTQTSQPGQPTYPDLAALTDIGPNQRGAVYWPFSGSAGPRDIGALGKLSAGGDASLTLVGSASTTTGAKGATVTARGTAAGAGVLVYDSAVSTALRDASLDDEASLSGAPLSAAAAYLTLASVAAGDAPLLVVVDRAAGRSALGLGGVVNAMARLPDTRAASLAELASASATAVTVADAAARPGRVAAIDRLEDDERDLASFSSILNDPTVLTGPQRAEILQLLGGGWVGQDDAWNTAVAAHEKAAVATLGAVSIAPTSSVNLVGSAAPLRFWVRNDLPWPVNVELIAQPDDLRLEVQQTTKVVAQPSSNTRTEVPVRAKIGNGEVTITLHLQGPTGVLLGGEQSVDVNVRADWEVAGLWIMGVLVGGFLILGLIRTIVARRRRSRTADAAPDADPDAAPAPAEAAGEHAAVGERTRE
ncbi:MAG: hypothetical protein J0J05_07740 [Microbacterium sp.]|uniref:DUF6049 family protein n=1 Tax=Microbacterium sp. TaxID=51671 RepID=UPI001AD02889|nr:DUF6049 family protein [Microbacterium sp.]MBN9153857.1 hypothetical protein [Microbacterium sp.]